MIDDVAFTCSQSYNTFSFQTIIMKTQYLLP